MAAGNIPKPTLWTFAFFSRLKGRCVHRDAHSVVTVREDGTLEGVVWNEGRENKSFRCTLALPGDGIMALTEERVEDGGSDPLKIWHDLGEPAVISKETEMLLMQSGTPRVSSLRTGGAFGPYTLEIRGSGVCFFRARPLKEETDPGYDYSYYDSQD